MTEEIEFSEVVADVLREVGNIGAGHAATALSVLLHEEVHMSVPSAKMMPFNEIPDLVGGAEVLTAGVFIQLDGNLGGNLLLIMPAESAAQVIGHLLSEKHSVEEFNAMDFSALAEVGNILGGSFMNAVSQLTATTFHLSVPGVAVDMAGAILNICMLSAEATSDKALIVDTRISQGENDIDAHIILIPNSDAMAPLLKALGC